MRGVESVLTEN